MMRIRQILAAWAACFTIGLAFAEEPAPGRDAAPGDRAGDIAPPDSAELKETRRLIDAELPKWQFRAGPTGEALRLEGKPVLRWTNPGTGRVYGDLFLWTDQGRPLVIMSLFKAWQPANGFHVELHSLTSGELEADRSGTPIWRPTQPGILLKTVPEAEAPAESPIGRLAPMKAISREFSIVLEDRRVNDAGEEQSLRLLNQPLYRYPASVPRAADGALFTFALGTDPEIFLLLEARQGGNGAEARGSAGEWQYGLVRMNDGVLTVLHKQREVFRSERANVRDAIRDPYVLTRLPEAP